MGFLQNHRRKLTIAGLLGGVGAVGVAFAATFLVATVSGTTAFATAAANTEVLEVKGTSEGVLRCGSAAESLTTPNLIEVKPEATIQNGAVLPGECAVNVDVKNNGTTDLFLAPLVNVQEPAGWDVSISSARPDFNIGERIGDGRTRTVKLVIKVDATAGTTPAPIGAGVQLADGA